MQLQKRLLAGALGAALVLGLVSTAGAGGAGAAVPGAAITAGSITRGGSMTVLESSDAASWATGLDPATSTEDLADAPYLDSIYGDLFIQDNDGSVTPDLATGYKFTNGARTLTITLRHGVKFSDGTPFDSAAVVFNFKRDLNPKGDCTCLSSFPVSSIKAKGRYRVVLQMTKPFSPVIGAFPGLAPNWIVSPTALKKKGEKAFSQVPVGAGPFTVASDSLNTVLTLKKNPTYWQKGHPYLDSLTFKAVGSDQSGYEAVLAGSADMTENVATSSLVPQAKQKLQVNEVVGRAGVSAVQLNTTIAPFTNLTAREAIYYATDAPALSKALSDGTGVVIQSPSEPGSAFYQPTVAGYRTYDLAKAKALVAKLGGLSITLGVPQGAAATQAEALQGEWQQAGIKVKLTVFPTLVGLLNAYKVNTWDALLQGAGGINPAEGTGGSYWRYYSTGPFTGIKSPALDKLVNEAAATTSQAKQVAFYKQVDKYLSDQALLPFTYLSPLQTFATHDVHGPGVSTPREFPLWQNVWKS